jgi:PilZ domain
MLGENLSPAIDSLRTRVQTVAGASTTNTRAASRTFPLNVQLIIRPSNSSQRKESSIRGYCKNLSQSGCGVITDCPPRVGDLYRFELPSDATHPIHGAHARCVRCHLLDEEAFEAGFSFLSPVDLNVTETQVDNLTDPLV